VTWHELGINNRNGQDECFKSIVLRKILNLSIDSSKTCILITKYNILTSGILPLSFQVQIFPYKFLRIFTIQILKLDTFLTLYQFTSITM